MEYRITRETGRFIVQDVNIQEIEHPLIQALITKLFPSVTDQNTYRFFVEYKTENPGCDHLSYTRVSPIKTEVSEEYEELSCVYFCQECGNNIFFVLTVPKI